MNLPADFPIAQRRVGFEWSAPWRYRRLWQVLTTQVSHSLTDSHDLQRDYHSLLARDVIKALPPPAPIAEPVDPGVAEDESLPLAGSAIVTGEATPSADGPADEPVNKAADEQANEAVIASASELLEKPTPVAWLRAWDAVLEADSPQAALFVLWYYRHLAPAVAEHLAPEVSELIMPLDSLSVLRALQEPRVQEIALQTLDAAWAEAVVLLGEEPEKWRWGDLHLIRFKHPLFDRATTPLKEKLSYPAYSRGGSGNTTNSTGFSPTDFLVRSGASFRMVLDVGRWDEAEMTNAPGQSGDPDSPFYRNLLEGWANDSSFPLLYSRAAVIANQALRIELLPD